MVSFVGFFLHFARLTNIVLISPSSHCWVFSSPSSAACVFPPFYMSDKLSMVSQIIGRRPTLNAPQTQRLGLSNLYKEKYREPGSGNGMTRIRHPTMGGLEN